MTLSYRSRIRAAVSGLARKNLATQRNRQWSVEWRNTARSFFAGERFSRITTGTTSTTMVASFTTAAMDSSSSPLHAGRSSSTRAMKPVARSAALFASTISFVTFIRFVYWLLWSSVLRGPVADFWRRVRYLLRSLVCVASWAAIFVWNSDRDSATNFRAARNDSTSRATETDLSPSRNCFDGLHRARSWRWSGAGL